MKNETHNKKKLLLLILINLLLIICIAITTDYIVFVKRSFRFSFVNENHLPIFEKGRTYKQICDRKYFVHIQPFIHQIYQYSFRDKIVKNSKKSILILGCSFANGLDLNDEETFTYQLSNHTNKTVYNRAINGGGVKEALFQTQILYILKKYNEQKQKNQKLNYADCIKTLGFDKTTEKSFLQLFDDKQFIKKINDYYINVADDKNIKCVIYVFIENQIKRLYSRMLDTTEENFRLVNYEHKNGDFKLKDIYSSGIRPFFLYYDIKSQTHKTKEEQLKEFADYIKEINRLLKLIYGENLRFIIINYNDIPNNYFYLNLQKFLNEFEIVKITELINGDINQLKYKTKDRWHPSKLVWEEATPTFIEKYQLEKN